VDKLPSTAGRILTNYWCGNERAWGWMGRYEGEKNDNGTTYQWIKTSAEGAPLNPPVDVPPVEGGDEIDWTVIDPIAPTFETTPEYTVEIDGNKANVTYTDVSGSAYKPIEMDVTELVDGKNFVHLLVTNNGTETVKLRVDIESKTQTSANTTCCNVSATKNGVEVYTDKEWGGSTFEIAAGETAVIEVVYDPSKQPTNIKIMVDSCQWDDSTSHAGSITISALDFTGEYVPEEPKPEEPKPEEPKIEYSDLYVEWKTENAYTITTTDTYVNAARISYADMVKNSWNNINIWVEDKSAGCSVFSMKLTNHGSATVSVWVQMKDAAGAELINQNVDIAAGEEQVFTFNYEGNAQMIFFFVDSTHEADADLNTGDITISEIKLGKVAASEEPPVQEELNLEWWTSSSDYSVNGNNVTYNGAGNSYSCAGAPIASLASGKTTFTVTITNNGQSASRVRVDIQGTEKVGNHTVINTGATGGDVWTDMEWGGSTVTVNPGESVTLVITYDETTERGVVTNLVVMVDSGRGVGDTFNSDVTFSGMSFQ
ncbi:MAG: hypothetical protein IKZ03_03670, partial [Clostridia bacterium]|nr:hypothetical protein [Clostridia bacterium]